MAALTQEQQAIVSLQQDLAATRQQVEKVSNAYDTLRAAHDALNVAAQTALQEKQKQIAESEDRLKTLIFRQTFDLLDSKDLKPGKFQGRATEAFKPWQKKFRAYCNSKRTGFRAALEWAEKQSMEITNPAMSGWDSAEAASPKLHDFLLQILDDSALLLIDKPELEGRGFEAWRLLCQQYAPSGGAYELDSMIALMTLHQCKSLTELPGAVAKFERDVSAYERRTGRTFPPEFKVPAFLRMVPKSHASDMRWRFSQGLQDYDTLKSSILTYSQHLRFDSAYGRGDNDMQVDALGQGWEAMRNLGEGWSDWLAAAAPEEVSAYYEGISAGLLSDHPEEPVPMVENDAPLNALYRKGKSKGKGKNRQKGGLKRQRRIRRQRCRPRRRGSENFSPSIAAAHSRREADIILLLLVPRAQPLRQGLPPQSRRQASEGWTRAGCPSPRSVGQLRRQAGRRGRRRLDGAGPRLPRLGVHGQVR